MGDAEKRSSLIKVLGELSDRALLDSYFLEADFGITSRFVRRNPVAAETNIGSGGGGGSAGNTGTTPGPYTITVTGTLGSLSATVGAVALTIK